MKRIESDIKAIQWPQEKVYAKVSDLSNLQSVVDHIPADQMQQVKITGLKCTRDSVSCSVQTIGDISLGIIQREPCKCVKYQTIQSPVKMTMWIQILPTSDCSCKIKITVDADLNVFMAGMLTKPITQAVGRVADMLASIPYND